MKKLYVLSLSLVLFLFSSFAQAQFPIPSFAPGPMGISHQPSKGDLGTHELLVRFSPQYGSRAGLGYIKESFGGQAGVEPLLKNIRRPGVDGLGTEAYRRLANTLLVRFEDAQAAVEARAWLEKQAVVEQVEPNAPMRLLLTPSDPEAGTGGQQEDYLTLINAYNAWSTQTGNASIKIAVIDAGVDSDHPDLASKLFTNPGETPGNGIDDDNNGYVDDYLGWDFVGADFASPSEDNDPNTVPGGYNHGVFVSGIAAAATNNATGLAGIGFNSSFMAIKVVADNDVTGTNLTTVDVIRGIIYAVENGADIVNLSLGTGTYVQALQDAVNYGTFNHDALMVAAAGNDNTFQAFYPAGCRNVLSVAATRHDPGNQDVRSSYSNWDYSVDISAPGGEGPGNGQIYSTEFDDTYGLGQGTSYACPVVAGAAALVKAEFPALNARQIGERLRVTADDHYAVNGAYTDLLGLGRLNMDAALTVANPKSVRRERFSYADQSGDQVVTAGERIDLSVWFTNFLAATSSALDVSFSVANPGGGTVSIVGSPTRTLGALGTLAGTDIAATPLQLDITSLPSGPIVLKLEYTDGAYTDYEYLSLLINASPGLPVPDFNTNERVVCLGDTVDFIESSTNAPRNGITSWDWDIDNDGTYDYIGQRDIEHVYAAPGVYSVKLRVRNQWGADSLVRANYVTVGQVALPFEEEWNSGFGLWTSGSSETSLAGYGVSGAKAWSVGAVGGNGVAFIEGFNYPTTGEYDSLII